MLSLLSKNCVHVICSLIDAVSFDLATDTFCSRLFSLRRFDFVVLTFALGFVHFVVLTSRKPTKKNFWWI